MGKKSSAALSSGTIGEPQTNLEQDELARMAKTGTSLDMPNYDKAIIDPRKFLEYSLNPDSTDGGKDKSRRYKSKFGYDRTNYESLIQQITDAVYNGTARLRTIERQKYGIVYKFYITIQGPNGQIGDVGATFIIKYGEKIPQMTTNFVRREGKKNG